MVINILLINLNIIIIYLYIFFRCILAKYEIYRDEVSWLGNEQEFRSMAYD